MRSFSKKSTVLLAIASMIAVALLGIATFFPRLTASAEEATIWEKIDIDLTTVDEFSGGSFQFEKKSGVWRVNEGAALPSLIYLYLFIQAAGGQGSSGDSAHAGYGGGAGGFVIAKINLAYTDYVMFFLGPAGGKYTYIPEMVGHGVFSLIMAPDRRVNGPTKSVTIYGGEPGTPYSPGKGGKVEYDKPDDFFQVIYAKNGADGGQGSITFTADFGFRQQFFIYRPAGACPSGQGGGGSVYTRGGDGGVLLQNGRDGSYGAGGGGAGYGASGAGFGGAAYAEVYMSNK